MQALNSYGLGIGRNGNSAPYSLNLLRTVAGAPRGSAKTSELPEMVAAAELAGVDTRDARLLMEQGPDEVAVRVPHLDC